MKRTFLKVALLSSLMLSMPVAFTSCKDYDEDIKNLDKTDASLQSQLDALKSELATVKAQAEAAQASANAAAEAAAKAKQEAIEAAIAEINKALTGYAKLEDLESIKTQLAALGITNEQTAASLKQQLETQKKAIEKLEKLIGATGDQGTASIADLQEQIKKINEAINACNQSMGNKADASVVAALQKQVDAIAQSIASNVGPDVVTLLSEQLRSLVFIPSLYVDGIEATEYDYLSYLAMAKGSESPNTTVYPINAATANQDEVVIPKNGQAVNPAGDKQKTWWDWKAGTSRKYVNPVRSVYYELNPGTAQVDPATVKFLERKVETVTRAAGDANVTFVGGQNNFECPVQSGEYKGNLKLSYTADGQNLNFKDKKHAWVMAAQIGTESNDSIVTSDYAMVYGAPVTPIAICYNQAPAPGNYPDSKNPDVVNDFHAEACPGNLNNHLWDTAIEAAGNYYSLRVQWDSSIDIANYLEIHYAWDSLTSNATEHSSMSLADFLANYGLTATYQPVDYLVGTNVTSDTKFSTNKGSVVTPCGVTSNGQPTGVANKNSVGRNPLYMVQVMDGSNVVLTGFVKIKIEEKVLAPITTDVFNLGELLFGCDGDAAYVTWSQINNLLLGIMGPDGMSRNDFVQNYELKAESGEAIQYGNATLTNRLTGTKKLGVITEITDETEASTNVLKWVFTMEELQAIYEMPNHTYTVWVGYQPKSKTPSDPDYALPLNVTVVKPSAGTVITKQNNYWMRNNEVAISNVKVPENGGIPTYVFDLDDEWYSTVNGVQVARPTIQLPADAAKFGISSSDFITENGTPKGYKYYFTANNNSTADNQYKFTFTELGKSYTVQLSVENSATQGILDGANHKVSMKNMGIHGLQVNPNVASEFNNNVIKATLGSTTETIAVLNQTTGEITYQTGPIAKKILNAYASYEDAASLQEQLDRLCAKLKFNVGIVAYYGSCSLVLPLTNGQWDVAILRPVNIVADEQNFRDATDNGSTLNVFDMLTFTDWRNQKFADNPWYFAYYQVTGVSINVDDITTDAANPGSGSFAKNESISKCFTYNPGPAITAATCSANNSAQQIQTAIVNTWKAAFGKLTYKNDGTNTKDFQVRIPMTVHYYWGDINIVVNATVYNTLH